MYMSCGAMAHAMNAFYGLTKQDIVSKTAILSAFIEQGQDEKALQSYCKLSQEEIGSNHQTFLMAVQAYGKLAEEEGCTLEGGKFVKPNSLEIGQAIHVDAKGRGLDTSLFVSNTVISMRLNIENENKGNCKGKDSDGTLQNDDSRVETSEDGEIANCERYIEREVCESEEVVTSKKDSMQTQPSFDPRIIKMKLQTAEGNGFEAYPGDQASQMLQSVTGGSSEH
ncbi:hypothetical protein L7F22_006009 [Adiantum nelumboides]|nr:hypothetical protein [Adiantum nelumboides]